MKLPTILVIDSSLENAITVDIQIPSGSEVFAGHFPGNPILPGVVQIDWAMQLAKQHLKVNPSGREIQVKFRNIIRPDIPVSLSLQCDPSKKRLLFSYKSGDTLMSSGQMKLEDA